MDVANAITARREAKGWTMNRLAMKAEVTWKRMHDYENRLASPSLKVLSRIAAALDCTEADLVS